MGIEKMFKRNYDDVAESLECKKVLIKELEESNRNNHDEALADLYSLLLQKLNRIESSSFAVLPELDPEKGFSYEWAVDTDGVKLQIDKIELDEQDDNVEVSSTMIFEKTIDPMHFMTVSEYAEKHGVEAVTVRQWIRRGKLFNVKKVAGEWLISELAVHETDRQYRPRNYYWKEGLKNVPEEYSFLKDYRSLTINQSNRNKTSYTINLYKTPRCEWTFIEDMGDYYNLMDEIEMDTKSREKFERFLLGCSDEIEQSYSIIL